MKAVFCYHFGPLTDLSIAQVPELEPKPSEIIIAVKSASVNFPDTLIVQGLYQYKPPLPFTPGSEVAGIVKSVGADVTDFKSGDRVFASGVIGGMAEEFRADQQFTFKMNEDMSFDIAATLIYTYATSLLALKQRAQLKSGETLLVMGAAGGIGSAAVELGKIMGARVIAAVSSVEKKQFCEQLGADEVIVYPKESLTPDQQKSFSNTIKELTQGKGVDVVCDVVGGNYSEPALRAMASQGRFLVVGFTSGTIPKIPLNLVLLKNCSIVGVYFRSFLMDSIEEYRENMEQILSWNREGKLKPRVTKTYAIDDALMALEDMAERRVLGKVVIHP